MSTISFFSPSEIERETGFGKEQLRKWRQRYGFPPRESTLDGQSTYSRKTVDQLHLIKRLLEAGFRPYQVVGKTVVELEKLKFQLGLNVEGFIADELSNKLIENIKLGDLKKFVALLTEKRRTQSMFDFVQSTIAPLMISIGDAWSRDESSQFCGRPHPRLSPIHCRPGLQRLLLLG